MSHAVSAGHQQTKDEFGRRKENTTEARRRYCNILTFVNWGRKREDWMMLFQGDNTRDLLIRIHQCCFTLGSASIRAMLAGGQAKIRLDEFFFFSEVVRGTVNDGISVNKSATDARVSHSLTLILNKHLTRPFSLPFDVCIQLNNRIVVVLVKSDSGSVRVRHTSNKR